MNKKNQLYREAPARWSLDKNKLVGYEFDFKGQTVHPGMKLKIKNERTVLTFICIVTKIDNGSTWLECTGPEGFRSVRLEKIMSVTGIKRSYTKNT